MKRTIAIMLCLITVLSLFPVTTAFAAEKEAVIESVRPDESQAAAETMEQKETDAVSFSDENEAAIKAGILEAELNAASGTQPQTASNPFTDVKVHDWFYHAVIWAYGEDITAGVGNNKFDPTGTLTRAQVVMFLWAKYGRPMPSSSTQPFADTKPGDWFYNAALWAREKGYVAGVPQNGKYYFKPNKVCTRAEAVTMLYAAAGKPKTGLADVLPYRDVTDSSAYYYNPLRWCVKKGLMDVTEVEAHKFDPGAGCTRALMVQMLYRAYSGNKVYRICTVEELMQKEIGQLSVVRRISDYLNNESGRFLFVDAQKYDGEYYFNFIDPERQYYIRVLVDVFRTQCVGLQSWPKNEKFINNSKIGQSYNDQYDSSFCYVGWSRGLYSDGSMQSKYYDDYYVYLESILVDNTFDCSENGIKSLDLNAEVHSVSWFRFISLNNGRAYVCRNTMPEGLSGYVPERDGWIKWGDNAAWLKAEPYFCVSAVTPFDTPYDDNHQTFLGSFEISMNAAKDKNKANLKDILSLWVGGWEAASGIWSNVYNPLAWWNGYTYITDTLLPFINRTDDERGPEIYIRRQEFAKERDEEHLTYKMGIKSPLKVKEVGNYAHFNIAFGIRNENPNYYPVFSVTYNVTATELALPKH